MESTNPPSSSDPEVPPTPLGQPEWLISDTNRSATSIGSSVASTPLAGHQSPPSPPPAKSAWHQNPPADVKTNPLPLSSEAAIAGKGQSGAPTPVLPASAATPEPKRKNRLPWAVAALALLAAAFSGGWAVAENQANERLAAVQQTQAAEVVPVNEAESAAPEESAAPAETETPAPVETAPPLADSVEPATAAAATVAPAVVLVQVPGFGQGSGIVFDDQGHLVTNAHVVGDATDVTIRLASGRQVDGVVVGADPAVDVAVVRIDPAESPAPATFIGSDQVEVGQLAVAIGSPFGLEQTVTAGVVSALDRVVPNNNDGEGGIVSMVQTDAPINPGNSGGALVDRNGAVIGMNTSIRTNGSNGSVGVGFAIPSDTVVLIADRIISGEPLEIGFFGVNLQEPTEGDPGAIIAGITEGGPASTSDLQIGDLVTAVDGDPVRSTGELAARVRLTAPGEIVELSVNRDGASLTIPVEVGALGDA